MHLRKSAVNVLEASVYLAQRQGLRALTRSRIAAQAGVSAGTVSNAFGDMDRLIERVVAACADAGHHRVVAEAVLSGHPAAESLPPAVKRRAIANATM